MTYLPQQPGPPAGYPPQPPPGYVSPAPLPPPAAVDPLRFLCPALGVLGGVLVMVGSLMPWGSAMTIFGTFTVNGTDGDGTITMVLGVMLAVTAGLTAIRGHMWLAILQIPFAIGVAVLAIYELVHVTRELREASTGFVQASVGAGLYVLMVGAALAAGVSVVHVGIKAARGV